ncbi:MAG: DUF2090 domain-containing protein [Candidatus Daviesbacteria bacterium]|nr:MAG: DUF2090 domain-containing protein [Candidatus Daviesbacteria bacterium]
MNTIKFQKNGKFLMLALDHRDSFKKIVNPGNPQEVTEEQIIDLKNKIINSLVNEMSGLLIDERFGLEACKEACQLKPFLLPVEKSGFLDQERERITELEYSVEQVKNLGASGAKLLVYFNPQLGSAKVQLETAKQVLKDCQQNNLPFFLEIVTYTPDVQVQFHIGSVDSKAGMVIESVRSFIEVGVIPDVWKLEYPGDEDACREISHLVGKTPWILLTGGVSFEEFKLQLAVATKAGARGFLAGRALWQEGLTLQGTKQEEFFSDTLPTRFKTLSEIVNI